MSGAGMQFLVVIIALFVVPKLMQYIPDFDPLMAIVGVFIILAGVQQLGFQMSNAEGAGHSAGSGTGSDTARRREEESQATEAGPEDLLREATRCFEQNSYARVQELARRASDLDPENPRAWELLASAQKWDGKCEEAAATVRKARELYEVDSEALRKLAQELEQGQAPAARAAECEEKGEEFFKKRQYDLAAECYSQAIDGLGEVGPGSDDRALQLRLRRRRAECAQQLQDWGTCRRDATALLEENPGDERALMQRAAANEALEKFRAALEDARKLLVIDPKNSAANRIVHNCQQALRG